MKLSVSNIAWAKEYDREMYELLSETGFEGLEIAPTRIIPDDPYSKIAEAKVWADALSEEWGLAISSMQSIWFGRSEMLFGSDEERQILLDYTKRAIEFAEVIHCPNLVFGSPKNRNNPNRQDEDIMIPFFRELGEYACNRGTVLSMEANPPIYGTNYVNETSEAISLVNQVDSKGFMLNLDLGTMIANQEGLEVLSGNESLIHHIHISEVNLRPIEKRDIHRQLSKILSEVGYRGFVSIEMKNTNDICKLQSAITYVQEVFG